MPQTFQRDNETIPTSDRIPVLPLRDVVIFPYVVIPLLVGRPASLAAIEAALAEDKIILLVAQRDGEKQEPAAADLHRTGVIGRISVSTSGAEANGGSAGAAISGDGLHVAFGSYATNLVAGDTNDHADVFVRNLG